MKKYAERDSLLIHANSVNHCYSDGLYKLYAPIQSRSNPLGNFMEFEAEK
jgi:hypothetical protein